METPAGPRLLDRVREKIRLKHYSIRTEQAYLDWIRRFIRFHGKRHPVELGPLEVEAFLTDLAVARRVSASTQNQAKRALLFPYQEVLGVELPWLDGIEQARTAARLPVVLTREEVAHVLTKLRGIHALIGRLLYGTGMRIMEGVRLRVKDVDFARHEILIRDGKGFKDRITMLPLTLTEQLRVQIAIARAVHKADIALGFGAVWLPYAIARKYPDAPREWGWQYVFPAEDRSLDPRSGMDLTSLLSAAMSLCFPQFTGSVLAASSQTSTSDWSRRPKSVNAIGIVESAPIASSAQPSVRRVSGRR